ncbi:MAG: hypothetical protein IME94_10750 [Proteobacteria bacterium]|nr:hypothetical protein [Pseudomonadota bacterium]
MNSNINAFSLITLSLILTACGGGGNPPPPTRSITGVAAAGAPIVGTVKIKDAAGTEKIVNISSDGSYSVDTASMTDPFILKADGTVSGKAFSITAPATSRDIGETVNITPLTDIVTGNVMGQEGQNAYQTGNFTVITDGDITAQEASLRQSLTGILTDAGADPTQSIIHTNFSANHTGFDLAMDMLDVEVDRTTDIATISLVDGFSSVTDDMTTQTSILTLSVAGNSTTSIVEYNTILSMINNFVTDINANIDKVTLASDYFASTFLDDGINNSDVFLSNIGAENPSYILSISNIAINKLDLTSGSEYADIRFTVSFNGVLYDNQVKMQLVHDGTKWIFNGNQKLASISLRPYAEKKSTYQRGVGETTAYSSGLSLTMDIVDASDNSIDNGITQATLSGPGLTSPVVFMPHADLSVRFVNGSSWNGFIPLIDARINEIKEGGIYSLVVDYNDGSAKQATYQIRLNKPPITSAQAASQSYTDITIPTPAAALDNGSGDLSVTWSLGNELTPFELDARSSCFNGAFGSTNSILLSNNTMIMTGTDYTGTCEGILRLTTLDKFNGEVVTTYEITN